MGSVRCRRVRPVDPGPRAVFVYFRSSMAEDRGGGRVGALLDAGVFCGRAVRRVCLGELPVNDPLERNKRNVTAFYCPGVQPIDVLKPGGALLPLRNRPE